MDGGSYWWLTVFSGGWLQLIVVSDHIVDCIKM